MRIPTVKIRNKRTGAVLKINARTWAEDLGLGRMNEWERVGGETRGDIDVKPEVERPRDEPMPFDIRAEAEAPVEAPASEATPDPLPEGMRTGGVVKPKRRGRPRKVQP